MTRNLSPARTTAALRALDAAPATALTDEERGRADALLDRIVTDPGHGPLPVEPPRRRRRRVRMLVPVGLLTATGLALTTLGGGTSAFATWTPTPAPLSPAAAAAAALTCREEMGAEYVGTDVALGERRGGWTYVLLTGGGREGQCLMPDEIVGKRNVHDGDHGFFGGGGPAPDAEDVPTPARDGIDEGLSGAGSVPRPGRLLSFGHDDWFTWVSGYAGRDVTAVTVHPPVGPDVEASLSGGRYAAWWPAGEARGGNPGVSGAWTYSVTLTDGTTHQVEAE